MRWKFLFVLCMISLAGCFTAKPVASKETFTFDYIPKGGSQSGSANMLCAFVKPVYAPDFTSGSGELFRSFQAALGDDIEELIISKGFTMKGPYVGFDEMIFEDKKRTEVLIQIEIAPRFTAHEGGWRQSFPNFTGNAPYSYSGKVSLVGKINLSGTEPLTNQKIWSKSVLIPNVEDILIQTTNKYDRVLTNFELINDPGVYNVLGKALMRQYTGIMEKIAAHFSVEEFQTLKGQIKELKSKKGY